MLDARPTASLSSGAKVPESRKACIEKQGPVGREAGREVGAIAPRESHKALGPP